MSRSRVIMSCMTAVNFARFMLLAVSEDFQVFAFVQCIIKQLLDSVFVISRIIKVKVRVISQRRRLRLITLTETLIILDITKPSSDNCFIIRNRYLSYASERQRRQTAPSIAGQTSLHKLLSSQKEKSRIAIKPTVPDR